MREARTCTSCCNSSDEAARVAALRGHEVILFEATAHLGGQIRTAAKAPNRAEYGRSINWLSHQIDKLGVDVRLSTHASVETVLSANPDVVVVATGSATGGTGSGRSRSAIGPVSFSALFLEHDANGWAARHFPNLPLTEKFK